MQELIQEAKELAEQILNFASKLENLALAQVCVTKATPSNEGKIQCLACADEGIDFFGHTLARHLKSAHNLATFQYEKKYNAPVVSETMSKVAKERTAKRLAAQRL